MLVAPRPVDPRKTVVAPAVHRKLGLLAMKVGSDHIITIARGTPQEQRISVRARSSEETMGVTAHYVCLHDRCAGKRWDSLGAMFEAHPGPDEMRKREEAHVFGLWCDEPFDAAEVEQAKAALAKADTTLAKLKERAAKAQGDVAIEDAEKRVEAAQAARDKAAEALATAQAPIGLIAPPEPRVEL